MTWYVRLSVKNSNIVNDRVWGISDAKKLMDDKDVKSIRTKWVITNKGDHANPDIRARLVAQEVNTFRSDDVFCVNAYT